MPVVTNIPDTSDLTCPCNGWLNHWNNFSGVSQPEKCIVKHCYKTDLVGAHVKKFLDNEAFIIPICQEHNKAKGYLVVEDGYFVSADPSKTCEK